MPSANHRRVVASGSLPQGGDAKAILCIVMHTTRQCSDSPSSRLSGKGQQTRGGDQGEWNVALDPLDSRPTCILTVNP